MALIVLHDAKQNRDRIINSDNIFQCVEAEGGVRVRDTEGSIGRDTCLVAGTLAEFAKSVGAVRVGRSCAAVPSPPVEEKVARRAG